MSMKRVRKSPNGVEQLFPALLFFVFLLCTMFTILIGSRVYENIRARNNASFHTDTALAYMTNKVRQSDRVGAVSVREMDGTPVLVLESEYNDILFETWIYQMDGVLWELFAEKDAGLDLSAGQMIMDCGPVSFELETQEKEDLVLTITLEALSVVNENSSDGFQPETKNADVSGTDFHASDENSKHTAKILLRSNASKKGGAD